MTLIFSIYLFSNLFIYLFIDVFFHFFLKLRFASVDLMMMISERIGHGALLCMSWVFFKEIILILCCVVHVLHSNFSSCAQI